MGVYEKLMKVQSELKAPKSQFNKFGNYFYRNCEDIQEAAKPLMQKVKATLIVGDELIQISERFYIKATARFIDCETGEEVSNTAYAREELEKKGMDASQVTGSTSSYARKYALNGLFCIDDVKDSDNQDDTDKGKKPARGADKSQKPDGTNKKDSRPAGNAKGKVEPAAVSTTDKELRDPNEVLKEKIDQAKLNVIMAELKRTGLDDKVVLNFCKIKKLMDMTNEQFLNIMKKFKATPSKEGKQ